MPLAVVLALALGSLPPHAGHAQESYELSIDQVVVTEGEGATALVSVLDAAGQPVPGLTDFTASIDGAPVALDSAEPVVRRQTGIAVLLAIDTSRSMTGEPFSQAKSAAAAFVDGLLPADVAGLLTFAGGVAEEVSFTNDRDELREAIAGLELYPGGGTALYDATEASLSLATRAPTPRRSVVLLTDGEDTASTRTRQAALDAAAGAGLPLFTIGLGDAAEADFLRALADAASGDFFAAPRPADVPRIFDRISAILRQQYALAFELPENDRPERELAVSVVIDGRVYAASTTFSTTPVALPPVTDEGSSLPSWAVPAALAVLALLAALLGGRLLWRRIRRRPSLPGGPGRLTRAPKRAENGRPAEAPAAGRLLVVEGPNAGASADLSAGPVDIGSAPSATLHLHSANGEVASAHARAWVRQDRLMLHHLARKKETLVGGKPVEWAALEPEDTFQIGQHVLIFELTELGDARNRIDTNQSAKGGERIAGS